MKHLTLRSPHYRYIIKSFTEYLDTLGYAWQTVYQLPNYITEFLHYMEQNGHTQIKHITNDHFKHHYNKLKHRTNERRGGGLSNAYLNKHQQAYYRLSEYLRQHGRHSLPVLDMPQEKVNHDNITLLTHEETEQLYQATYLQPQYTGKAKHGDFHQLIGARDRAMLTVFYACGLRRTEGVSLDTDDIHYERQVIHVRKGKGYKERFVPINRTNLKTLEHYVYDVRPPRS